MSLLEQQNFLAQIYTDENLRRAFLAEPEKVGKSNNLDEAEINEILEIFPDEINAFAESLIWKRLREVEKLLPLTRRFLAEDFIKSFRKFAPTFNSTDIKKHLADALEFSQFLQRQSLNEPLKNISKYERSKLLFNSGTKNFVVTKFQFDVREMLNQAAENIVLKDDLKRRRTLAIWMRVGKIERHFIV